MSERAARLLGAPEKRYGQGRATALEFRDDDVAPRLDGYASVFDAPYEVFGGPDAGGWIETVDRRAFDRTLSAKPDVHLLVNHDGMPLADTITDTLRLDADKRGLHSNADLDIKDFDVQWVLPKLRRGTMRQMSFAFRTPKGGDEWNKEQTHRRLLEVNIDHGDVSIVNRGANPATSVHVRSALELLGDLDADDALTELRGIDDPLRAIARAQEVLAELRRNLTPAERRCLSVLDADLIAASR